MQLIVNRSNVTFAPDPSRVIARYYYTSDARSIMIIRRVLSMTDEDVHIALSQVLRGYSKRHRNISKIFEKHFFKCSHLFEETGLDPEMLLDEQKLLIGSYFTMEYSIEAAAFFNPSIVPHPDQTEIAPGEERVILSFRATGEGHISSIVFRTGVLDQENNLTLEPVGKMLDEAQHVTRFNYEKSSFRKELDELQDYNNIAHRDLVLKKLSDTFTYGDLKRSVDETRKDLQLSPAKELLFNRIMWLASSHYEIKFSLDTAISERVIFPISETERNGIEDARFVRFCNDDGSITYYATYTAYDGMTILPKLLETKDFYDFTISPVHGEVGRNKGMALFPRKINGKYAMLCRIDGFNNYIAFSDNLNVWREAKLIQQPKYPWEFIQVGNNGSPIETDEGWLVITHAVGPMREYVMGACLLDLNNPEKVIGRLKTPLMIPNAEEREGYVPNVIYSCGSIIHNEDLIIPYAMSDYASTYGHIKLRHLLDVIKNNRELPV